MFKENFHTHSTYCDGKNPPEETVLQAIKLGFEAIGFSGHAYMDRCDWCMTKEGSLAYIDEINMLREKYADKIRVYCGAELDYYCDDVPGEYDFTIGSVHYIERNGEYLPIDSCIEDQKEAADKYFDGSLIKYAAEYFRLTGDVIEVTKADFVGHFDLVTKFNEGDCYFDTTDPIYVRAWKEAAEKLLSYNVPFEINTGAIARKKRITPYPAPEIARFIGENGGKFIVTSDCHDCTQLDCAFDDVKKQFGTYDIISFDEYLRTRGNK